MTAKMTLQIVRKIIRDDNNALCSALFLVVDGLLVKPTKIIGNIYAWRTWANGKRLYSRGDMVFEAYGELYRMGTKTARLLRLASGERLETTDFDPSKGCFVVSPPADRLEVVTGKDKEN